MRNCETQEVIFPFPAGPISIREGETKSITMKGVRFSLSTPSIEPVTLNPKVLKAVGDSTTGLAAMPFSFTSKIRSHQAYLHGPCGAGVLTALRPPAFGDSAVTLRLYFNSSTGPWLQQQPARALPPSARPSAKPSSLRDQRTPPQ
jgi:hypothetical protein